MTTKELKQMYFVEFKFDTRLPELFELIPEKQLREWLIDQLVNY
jgi:hypothetical protein